MRSYDEIWFNVLLLLLLYEELSIWEEKKKNIFFSLPTSELSSLPTSVHTKLHWIFKMVSCLL